MSHKAHLLDGPFAGETRAIMDGDGLQPRVMVGRCTCCDAVTVAAPGGPVHTALEADGVLFVAYMIARMQPAQLTLQATVAYEVYSERRHDDQEQLAEQVDELVAL